ncbi:protoporphyrinogen oxidase [Acidiferrimicrobium sp. IK]|uniref:protoporphyrinogen oxidase n=1 Tax=Acidiferrimicrobium sp. IK TaxID=2871700 RepID=UPI0021CB5493|nr:protoporphyrinogen oxidase [Acidiferrimicrobium sp. IK]MCU4186930.1 protoporphyrinogen oxidase [Acidiferrimicrobium sp. IK]
MRYAVAGGGIAGLAAAWELTGSDPAAEVVVYEPGRLGGKIHTPDFEGRPVDAGPDAFLTRVPEAVQLCAELGLADELLAPAAGSSMVWWGQRLRPLPAGLVLGVPGKVSAIVRSGILSPLGAARAGLDLVLPRTDIAEDVSVYDLVARRFGKEVALRLVDPLVGGIHAGRADELSAAATVPQLLAAARKSRSLLLALRGTSPSGATGPIFLTPRDGLGRMVAVLVERLVERGVAFRDVAVRYVRPAPGGGVTLDGGERYDGAVVAAPAPAAAGIVEGMAPDASAGLRLVDYASVALVTMSFAASSVPAPEGVNGFLVPRSAGRLMTACSFASNKWPHWSEPGTSVVRLSAGRFRDHRALDLDDETLVDRLAGELGAALGRSLPEPTSTRVARWPAAFPQYTVGHLERVASIETSLRAASPAVALAGSSYRGSGIPACIGSGRRAARAVIAAGVPAT